jgi:DNA-binding MarR family transcriptional regulator
MFDRCIYFNLSTLSRQITKIWNDEFALLGLAPSHGYVLTALTEKPDASQKELSEIMELDASTITRFIDVLVSKNLIEKNKAGKGARYTLTTEGKALSKKVSLLMDKLYADMQATFGKKKFSDFVTGLKLSKQILQENDT